MNIKKQKKRVCFVFLILFLMGVLGLLSAKRSFVVSNISANVSGGQGDNVLPLLPLPKLPEKDPNLINILLLGGRGSDDPGEGKLLSDTIIIASIKKGDPYRLALISIPRDLYVRLWCVPERKKINVAYAYGGLDCIKKTVAAVTGLYIDHAVSVNFDALVELVDAVGGIDIYLDEPFEETFQWAQDGREENENWFIKEFEDGERWVFYVSEGSNHLDGKTTLYYARSRYSTNDFDRMYRQQRIIMALKDKVLSLGVLANPVKIYNLIDIISNNIHIDSGIGAIKDIISLVYKLDTDSIEKKVFDISPDGLLYHTFIDEEYILLPIGDNFTSIRDACKNIFDE